MSVKQIDDLSESSKAILQRFLIEYLHGCHAVRTFHDKLFPDDTNSDFKRKLEFRVEHWANWTMSESAIRNKISRVGDKLEILTAGIFSKENIDLTVLLAGNIRMNNSNEVVFSKFAGFEFVEIVAENNDLFELETDQGNKTTGVHKGTKLINLITEASTDEGFKVKYPYLIMYAGDDYVDINNGLRDLYRNRDVAVDIKSKFLATITDFNAQSKFINMKIEKLLNCLLPTPFFVYRGGRAPLLSENDDTYTLKYPLNYVCTSFLSTSCDYITARNFTEYDRGRVIWKLRLCTSTFACLVPVLKEVELLFRPGQHIEFVSIDRNEDGITVLNGVLHDKIDELPSSKSEIKDQVGSGDPSEPTQNAFSDHIPEHSGQDIFDENKSRKGTPDSPYLLFLEESELMDRRTKSSNDSSLNSACQSTRYNGCYSDDTDCD